MDKLLTIAVPAYNAQQYLEKCLLSFIDESVLSQLDVIVVNDGSTDGTREIADCFLRQYPHSFQVIDKENGGHGSGINAAIKIAKGKYFKVVDADDWVVTENLVSFLAALSQTNADVVLTHYHTIHMVSKEIREFRTKRACFGKEYAIEDFMRLGKDAMPCCTFHGICYRTSFYRESGVIVAEGVFYEDQEYATVPVKGAESILPLDMFLYEYLIGNTEQSVSALIQVARISQLETVFWRIYDCYDANRNMSEGAKQYFLFKMAEVLLSYYVIALIKNPDRHAGYAEASKMRKLSIRRDRALASATSFKYWVTLCLHGLYLKIGTLEALKDSALYHRLRRLMH